MAEHKNMKEYHGQIQEALDDKFLRKTLDKFAVDYKANRARIKYNTQIYLVDNSNQ